MNGIEKILAKIEADAQAAIDANKAEVAAKLAAAAVENAQLMDADRKEILARGELKAAEREARLLSAAQMEAKKLDLAARQQMIGKAFDGAVKLLCSLEEKDYIALLTRLAVEASSTGSEALIFSQKDRATVGKQVVIAANEALAKNTMPELPAVLKGSKIGNIIGTAAAKLSGTAALTLSQETRPMEGGFILVDGDVEVNCAFETLVRLQRENLETEVAAVLFQ